MHNSLAFLHYCLTAKTKYCKANVSHRKVVLKLNLYSKIPLMLLCSYAQGDGKYKEGQMNAIHTGKQCSFSYVNIKMCYHI